MVADTDRSLKFYRDTLGMQVVGESENYGTEQEHLNNVFGARLRITGLRATTGPAIEFLMYIAPRGGRPMPIDSRVSDIWNWQIHILTSDVVLFSHALRKEKATFISPGPVTLPDASLGFDKGIMIRDPDGHVLLLYQR